MKEITANPADLLTSLEKSFPHPSLVLVTGSDSAMAAYCAKAIKSFLQQKSETQNFEQIVFSPDEPLERFLFELENQPIFANPRLLLIYDGTAIFQELKGSKKKKAQFETSLRLAPQNLIILFSIPGKLSASNLTLFDATSHTFHLITKPLYENQVHRSLIQSIKEHKIELTEEAWGALRAVQDHRKSSHLKIANRLKEIYAQKIPNQAISKEEIQTLFTPEEAMNMFNFVDYLFAGNFDTTQQELTRYNPKENSFMVVLKLILNRLNEIRKFDCAQQMGYSDSEMKKLLSISHLPPFIQKRILTRSHGIINRIPLQKQLKLYEILLQTQISFRTNFPQGEQLQFFRCQILPFFFER